MSFIFSQLVLVQELKVIYYSQFLQIVFSGFLHLQRRCKKLISSSDKKKKSTFIFFFSLPSGKKKIKAGNPKLIRSKNELTSFFYSKTTLRLKGGFGRKKKQRIVIVITKIKNRGDNRREDSILAINWIFNLIKG